MRKTLAALTCLAALLASAPAHAQNTTGLVVSVCGTVTTAFVAGRPGPFTIDVNGVLCSSSSGGGGGAATIADGADVTQGAIADAAATQGGAGTLSAKLRLLTTQFNTLNTTVATAASQALTQTPVAPAAATATRAQLAGCQATSAAINPTTGQQAAIDCDLNNNLLVSPGGAPNLTTAQVTVTTSSTSVVAARALRRNVTITNITGTQQVYCSGTTATTGNGQLIPAVVGASWNVSTTAAINCIAVSSSQTVSTAETF